MRLFGFVFKLRFSRRRRWWWRRRTDRFVNIVFENLTPECEAPDMEQLKEWIGTFIECDRVDFAGYDGPINKVGDKCESLRVRIGPLDGSTTMDIIRERIVGALFMGTDGRLHSIACYRDEWLPLLRQWNASASACTEDIQ